MFVFSRRAIQRCVNELVGILPKAQLDSLVKRLNQVGRDRFAVSWEVCLLHSLSQVGAISHEAPLPSGRKPDVSFTYPGEKEIGFIADVTAISDQGLHSANPVRELAEELVRLARLVGLDPNHFRYEVRGGHTGPEGFQKVKFRLPPQGELSAFLDARIRPFFESIRDNQSSYHHKLIEEGDIAFTIHYNPSQKFMSGGYPAYDVALSPKKNPLWTQLINKASQLDGAASIAPTGIIACDAGCSLFHRTKALGMFTALDVMQQFFREHLEISFVLLLHVKDRDPLTREERVFTIDTSFYSVREDSKTLRLRTVLADAVARLPKPRLDSHNAYIRCREPGYDRGHFGGHKLSRSFVKMSARTVLELLAGRINASTMNEAHDWLLEPGCGSGMLNPFERCLREGRLITRIQVDAASEDESDDWLTIEFGEPDPAISPFVVKPKSKG